MKIFTTVGNFEDCLTLQNLSNESCIRNELLSNIDKCKCTSFDLKKKHLAFDYKIESTFFDRCELTIDSKVSLQTAITL